jgi:hypothetical protein
LLLERDNTAGGAVKLPPSRVGAVRLPASLSEATIALLVQKTAGQVPVFFLCGEAVSLREEPLLGNAALFRKKKMSVQGKKKKGGLR